MARPGRSAACSKQQAAVTHHQAAAHCKHSKWALHSAVLPGSCQRQQKAAGAAGQVPPAAPQQRQ